MLHGSRNDAKRLLGWFTFSQKRTAFFTAVSAVAAFLVAYAPSYEGLDPAGQRAMLVLVFCAGMWITEAIPAFATSLLAIGLLIALLGRPNGVFAEGPKDWEQFVRPWGSPLIWLFFGGFCLASAAEKTGLDRRLASRALGWFGKKPAYVLLGVMAITAVLSMFVSNTATATLVLAMLTPVFAQSEVGSGKNKALALGVAMAANIGGMGTVIGTPPNAIAAGLLGTINEVDFAEWMLIAAPPALLLLGGAWFGLTKLLLREEAFVGSLGLPGDGEVKIDEATANRQFVVMGIFALTVGLRITSPLHGLPTTLISFVPITALTATGILVAEDIRKLPWDILLLIAGGLSLGVAMGKTGLASWAVAQLPVDSWAPAAMALGFCYLAIVMSNLMSNTATANLLLPIAIAVLSQSSGDARLAAPIALSASAAMCLPISTPPNAIVYGSGHLKTKDLMVAGLAVGVVTPPLVVGWFLLVIGWL